MEIYDNHPLSKEKIDEHYYKEQILELRNSPNVINDLFIGWKSRFKSRRERAMLGELEEWYNSVKTLSGAQADALMERMRARDAMIDFDISNTETYRGERKDTKILEIQAQNEKLRAEIAEAKRRQEGPKEGAAAKEPPKAKLTREEWRQKMVDDLNTIISDEMAKHDAINERLNELDEKRRQWEEDARKLTGLPEGEIERRLQEIESIYINLRKKILTATPRGRT